MEPPPEDLPVVVRHEGIAITWQAWTLAPSVGVGVAALALVGVLAATLPWWVLGGLLIMSLLLTVLVLPLSWRLDLNDRWIEVERKRLGGHQILRIPLEKLERWAVVEPREDYGGYALLLRGADGTHRVLEGMEQPHLEWIAAALDEAMERRRRREAVEGREWGFQKVVPKDVKALLERE